MSAVDGFLFINLTADEYYSLHVLLHVTLEKNICVLLYVTLQYQ